MKQRTLGTVGFALALFVTLGCGDGATVLDRPPDSGAEDGGALDATPRIVPLLGTATDIVVLGAAWTERPTLYLPNGWVAGVDAWLDLERFTFDAAGVGHPSCHLSGCTLTLDPSDGCAHYRYDGAELRSGDQGFILDGDLVACDDGSTPSPPMATLTATVPGSDRIGLGAPLPTSALAATTATPIETSTGTRATLRVDGSDVAATIVATPGQLTLTPAAPFRIGAAVTVALDGVTDVMGRAFTEPVALDTLSTTTTVADLTFTVAAADGSVAANGAAVTHDAGVLCLGGELMNCAVPSEHPLGVALALASPDSDTTLTLTLGSDGHPLGPVFAAISRSDGTTGAAVSLTALTADIQIPAGSGPIWLLLYAEEQRSGPCPAKPSFPSVCLDAMTLR